MPAVPLMSADVIVPSVISTDSMDAPSKLTFALSAPSATVPAATVRMSETIASVIELVGKLTEALAVRLVKLPRLQLGGEFIGYGGVHKDAVGADTGLTAVTKLGGHAVADRLGDIGIIEDDIGSIATELE